MSAAMPLPSARSLSLAELALDLSPVEPRVLGDSGLRVGDVRQDSRAVLPGDLFAARVGAKASGASFARAAVFPALAELRGPASPCR